MVIIGQNQPISPELRNRLLKSGASLDQLKKAKDLIKSSQNIDLNQFEDDISGISNAKNEKNIDKELEKKLINDQSIQINEDGEAEIYDIESDLEDIKQDEDSNDDEGSNEGCNGGSSEGSNEGANEESNEGSN